VAQIDTNATRCARDACGSVRGDLLRLGLDRYRGQATAVGAGAVYMLSTRVRMVPPAGKPDARRSGLRRPVDDPAPKQRQLALELLELSCRNARRVLVPHGNVSAFARFQRAGFGVQK
jgi:hypothetical protein